MLKKLCLCLILLFLPSVSIAESGWQGTRAQDVATDTTNFNGNLSVADETVQQALDTMDEMAGVGGGAPTNADYLVGTANSSLSAEIAVGTTPGGELGGTWASPTLDDNITVTGWVMGASTATTPAANDADTSLATTAFCETTQDYLKTSENNDDAASLANIQSVCTNDFHNIGGTDANTTYTAGDFITLTGTDFDVDALDEDDMASNSNTQLATQQSIKAYADTKQTADDDLTDLADGSLTASKVAGVADADYGDISVSGGTWSVDVGGGDLKADGTVPLTNNWDMGNYTVQADTFQADVVFVGALTGNVTGNCSGTSATFTGNLSGEVTSVAMTTTIADNVTVESWTMITPALGTPTELVGTNITGTASGLTAGNVTTNANLTGEVTSVGNAATISDNVEVQSWTLVSPVFTTAITATDLIKDTHIDWGTGAGQVSGADITFAEGDMTDSTIVTEDIKDGTITAADTAITAGRSLTLSTNDIAADTELYTDFKSATIETPADADNFFMFEAPFALTITRVHGIVESATSAVITFQECDSAGDNPVTIESITADADGTIVTSGDIDNAGIDAGDIIRIDVGTVTGTVGQVSGTLTFTKND